MSSFTQKQQQEVNPAVGIYNPFTPACERALESIINAELRFQMPEENDFEFFSPETIETPKTRSQRRNAAKRAKMNKLRKEAVKFQKDFTTVTGKVARAFDPCASQEDMFAYASMSWPVEEKERAKHRIARIGKEAGFDLELTTANGYLALEIHHPNADLWKEQDERTDVYYGWDDVKTVNSRMFMKSCTPLDFDEVIPDKVMRDVESQMASFTMRDSGKRFNFKPDCQWYATRNGKTFTFGDPKGLIRERVPEFETIRIGTAEYISWQQGLLRSGKQLSGGFMFEEQQRIQSALKRARKLLEELVLNLAQDINEDILRRHDFDVHGKWHRVVCEVRKCGRSRFCESCKKCAHHCHCNGKPVCPIHHSDNMHEVLRQGARNVCTYLKQREIENSLDTSILEQSVKEEAQSGFYSNPFLNTSHDFTTVLEIPAVTQLLDMLKSEKPEFDWLFAAKELVFYLGHLYQSNFSTAGFIWSTGHLLSNLGIKGLSEQFVRRASPNAQSESSPMAILSLTISVVLGAIVTLIVGKLPDSKTIDSFINRFSRVGHMITSVEKLSGYTESLAKTFISLFKKTVFGFDDADLNEWKNVDEWCEEVTSLQTIDLENKIAVDPELKNKVVDLLARGNAIHKMLVGLKVSHLQIDRINRLMVFLHRVRETAAGTAAGECRARIAPIVIHLVGDSGLGKSAMLSFLNADLLIALGHKNPHDLVEKVYYRHATNEFYDGMRQNTQIVVYDDFGALKDSANRPSPEVHEQILSGNNAPYSVTMAHLLDKGNTTFEARVIIWTSNRSTFVFDSLTNPEAVLNRVSLRFKVEPREGYGLSKNVNGKVLNVLNSDKVLAESSMNPTIVHDCWKFTEMSTEGVQGQYTLGESYGFEKFSEKCVATLNQKEKVGKLILNAAEEYFKFRLETAQAGDEYPAGINNNLIATFSEPNFLMRRLGAYVHINVYKTMVNMNNYYERNGRGFRGALYQTLDETYDQEYPVSSWIGAACYKVPYDQAFLFCAKLNRLYRDYMLDGDVGQLEPQRFGAELCECHDDARSGYEMVHQLKAMVRSVAVSLRTKFLSRFTPLVDRIYNFIADSSWTYIMVPAIAGIFSVVLTEIVARVLGNEPPSKMIVNDVKAVYNGVKSFFLTSKDKEEMASYAAALAKAQNGNSSNEELYVMFSDGRTKLLGPYDPPEYYRLARHQREQCEGAYSNEMAQKVQKVEGAYSAEKAKVVAPVEGVYSGDRARIVTKVEAAYAMEKAHQKVSVEAFEQQAQSFSDQNAGEIRSKVYKNVYLISSRGSSDSPWVNMGTVTMLKGRIGLTNRHIVHLLRTDVCLTSAGSYDSRRQYMFKKEDLVCHSIPDDHLLYGQRDVAVVEFPRQVELHADITKHFMTRDDFTQHEALTRVCLVGFNQDGILMCRSTDKCVADHQIAIDLDYGSEIRRVRKFYKYGIDTQKGDCGGLAIAFDSRTNKKIIGIHMSGFSEAPFSGTAAAIHQEMLQVLLSGLKTRWPESGVNRTVTPVIDLDVTVTAKNTVECAGIQSGAFTYHGKLEEKLHAPTQTKLRKSPIFGVCGDITKKPAHLRPVRLNGEIIDPMQLALKKASTPAYRCEPSVLRDCSNSVSQMINLLRIDNRDMRTLTFQESIAGIIGDPWYAGINRSSSPGFGWDKTGKGKTKWLGAEEYVVDHPELTAAYEQATDKLESGLPVGTYWTDTLKDELRPIEKVNQGKTRQFSAGEMVYTLLVRKYFMGFAAHMSRNRVDTECCVGVNPYSSDWSKIAEKLKKKGPYVVAGDFSNYDGSLPAEVLWEVLEIINRFYTDPLNPKASEHDNNIRRLLWVDIVNSIHVCGDMIYMWNHSQPSGCPITSILNSTLHSVIVRMVFVLAARKYAPSHQGLADFDRFVTHVNYGDDDITNISPDIIDWFNQETMAEMYATFGMTYTDELKTGAIVKCRQLSDVQFLKRKFVWDKEFCRWMAPLSLETVLETPSWVRGPEGAIRAAQNLEMAAYELSQHDRETWAEHFPKFEKAQALLFQLGATVYFQTYDEYRQSGAREYFGIPSNPSDQGFKSMAEILDAANPAAVAQSTEQLGEVFTSIDRCAPDQVARAANRRSIQPTTENAESRLKVVKGLAQSNDYEAAMPGNSNPTSTGASGPTFAGETEMVQQHQIMKFFQDGDQAKSTTPSTRVSKRYISDAQDKLVNDIKGYLRRPVHMKDFIWQSSTGQLGQLAVLSLPRDFFAIPMIAEKLSGFRYIRCDFVVEIQVNAQPFNAGAAILWFEPLYYQNQNRPSSAVHLGGVTGYRHTIYRCGDATSVQIRVPFFGTISHYDLLTKAGTAGRVVFEIMSPLTGASDIDGTVFCWAENIDITMPTGVPQSLTVQAQSGEFSTPTGEDPTAAYESVIPSETVEIRKKDATAPERRTRGIVENITKAMSIISTGLTVIPSLAPVAALSAGIFTGVNAFARFFGWSMPLDQTLPTAFMPVVNRFFSNAGGETKAKVLALDFNNACDLPIEVFGTDEDEMALNYILKKPIYFDLFTMNTSQTQGTVLWKWAVDPLAVKSSWHNTDDMTTRYIQFQETLLSYCTRMAAFWRGSIELTLMAVLTNFHSARFRVIFVPGATEDTDFSTIDINKCYSEIHDLRNSKDIKITIPFTYNQPWKQTWDESIYTRAMTDINTLTVPPIGMIYVTVVNALRAPATVADSIELLAFVNAGKDFQLAFPQVPQYLKPLTRADQVREMVISATAQSGIYPSNNMTETDPNAIAIGEVYTGFRQWLKRFSQIFETTAVSTVNPFKRNISPDTVFNTLHSQFDLRCFLEQIYRFQSGSVRVMNPNPTGTQTVTCVPPFTKYVYQSLPEPENQRSEPVALSASNLEPLPIYEVPFYQQYPAIPTALGDPREFSDSDRLPSQPFENLPNNDGTLVVFNDNTVGDVAFAAGESFSFGYLIGPPLTILARRATPTTSHNWN